MTKDQEEAIQNLDKALKLVWSYEDEDTSTITVVNVHPTDLAILIRYALHASTSLDHIYAIAEDATT